MDMQFENQLLVEDVWRELSDDAIARIQPDTARNNTSDFQKASQVVSETASEPEAVEEIKQDPAFDAGYLKGKTEAEETLGQQITALTQQNTELLQKQNELLSLVNENISQEKLKFSTLFQEEVKNIIFMISKAVVQAELSLQPEKIQNAIADALNELTKDKPLTIFVHPEKEPLLSPIFKNENRVLSTDSHLGVHDFYITQGHSRLEGELEIRIKQSIASVYNI